MLALEDLDCITDQLRVLAWHFLDFGMGFSDTLATDGAGHIMLATFSFLLGHFSFFFPPLRSWGLSPCIKVSALHLCCHIWGFTHATCTLFQCHDWRSRRFFDNFCFLLAAPLVGGHIVDRMIKVVVQNQDFIEAEYAD